MVVTELTEYKLSVAMPMPMSVPIAQRRLDSSHTIHAASPAVLTAGASWTSWSSDTIALPPLILATATWTEALSSASKFMWSQPRSSANICVRQLQIFIYLSSILNHGDSEEFDFQWSLAINRGLSSVMIYELAGTHHQSWLAGR